MTFIDICYMYVTDGGRKGTIDIQPYMRVQGPNAQCMDYHDLSSSTAMIIYHHEMRQYSSLLKQSHNNQPDSNPQPFDLEANALPSKLPCFGLWFLF